MREPNEPAFPFRARHPEHDEDDYGLSKMEYIATHVLAGMVASGKWYDREDMCAEARQYAHALLRMSE